MKKEVNLKKILDFLLVSAWVFMGIVLVIYILYGSKTLMNSDSAFVVDYSLEQIETKSIFPKGWYETNDFWIYSLIPVITPLIKLGFSLFSARQTAVLVQSIVLFILLFKLFYEKERKTVFLVPGLLIVSGISGQVLFEVFGDATYGTIIVYMLLVLYFTIKYLTKNNKIYLTLIVISMILLTMCSLRFHIYITAPLIVVLVYLYIKNGIKKEYVYLFIGLMVSSIVGFLLNKFLIETLLYTCNIEKNVISSNTTLSDNFFAMFYQFLWICGATNVNVSSLTITYTLGLPSTSFAMVFVFVRYLFGIFNIAIPVMLRKKIGEFSLKEKIIYIYIVSLIIIIVFFLLIGSMAVWYRYFVPVIFCLSLLYIPFYKYFIKESRIKVIFIVLVIIFCVYSVYLNIESYYNKENYYQGLADFLVENDLDFGYTYFLHNEKNLFSLLTNGELRVVAIESETLKNNYWLVSKRWFQETNPNSKAFFMRREVDPSLEEYEGKADEILTYQINGTNYNIYIFEDGNSIRQYFNSKS